MRLSRLVRWLLDDLVSDRRVVVQVWHRDENGFPVTKEEYPINFVKTVDHNQDVVIVCEGDNLS